MEQALLFRLGTERYALELTEVQEVVESPPLYYIPRAGGDILGAINFHGSILPVLDLARHIGRGNGTRDGRIVVLAAEGCALAIAVTALLGIAHLDMDTAQPGAGEEGWARAICEHEGEGIKLLDMACLLASLETIVKERGGDRGAKGADR